MLARLLLVANRFLLLFFASHTEALERAVFVCDTAIAAETARAVLFPPRVEKEIHDDSLRSGNVVTARRVFVKSANSDQRLFRVIGFHRVLVFCHKSSSAICGSPASA